MTVTTSPPQTALQCVISAVRADPARAARGLDITPANALNLARLAEYLAALPPGYQDFDMGQYMVDREGYTVQRAGGGSCGAVACAVGHGPSAGIPAMPREDWNTYYTRALLGGQYSYTLWFWMFSGMWSDYDNTPGGAAARICYALQHGAAAVEELNKTGMYQRLAAYQPYGPHPAAAAE